mmetsp:Transcript_68567/g.108892  ORF Transcript_68567/g.108892 Transcript_68567/m.108892 type:complete len:350 (-) Transcript_68567:194-1243(-)
MSTLDALFNVLYNLTHRKSRTQIFIILVTFYVALRTISRRKPKLSALQREKQIKIKDQVLITFSGGGQLGFYYQGICAYLRDNFELENVRFAGISAGSTAAASLASRLPTEASMIFGLRWFKLLDQRRLKFFFLAPSTFCDVAAGICEQFGITDEWITSQNEKTDYFYGVTNIKTWPPTHELIGKFESRRESFYAMSCSMRVLPFFTRPGYYRNMWLLDGGFSALFSVPKDANPDKIIRITPSTRITADVQPNVYSKQYFRWIDAIKMPSLQFIFEQFERGYNDAIRCRNTLIAKGLKPKKAECANHLNSHLDTLKKYAQQIFHEEDGLRNQDFSHFLPEASPPPQHIN